MMIHKYTDQEIIDLAGEHEAMTVLNINEVSDFTVVDWYIELDSNTVYILWGVINMTWSDLWFKVPLWGCYFRGYNFDLCWLRNDDDNYTMFTSVVGWSGNILMTNIQLNTNGTSSMVFDIVDSDGTHAIEFNAVNFNNCSSLGEIDWYRQGLESGTGRFWWSPSLTLSWTRSWWYFIETSIIRGMSDTTTDALYKEGTSFIMWSRFRSNQNIDLGTLQPFFDFQPSNFTNPSTVQLDWCIITRDWVFNPNDSNITPNMSKSDLVSNRNNNFWIDNTFVGGNLNITTEATTTITVDWQYETLLGTLTWNDLQHFDSPSNWQIRHLWITPREYKITTQFSLACTANNILGIRVRKYDSSLATTSTVFTQQQQVNNFAGSRDVAFSIIVTSAELDQNDYLFMEVANIWATNNIIADTDWFILVEAR